ncbi:group II intron reverse transcriptase/maturase, partial [Rossellomorea vietnamensis]
KVKTKHRNLTKLGIQTNKAWEWANTRLGYWRIAKSPILDRALDNQYWSNQGLKSLLMRYQTLRLT